MPKIRTNQLRTNQVGNLLVNQRRSRFEYTGNNQNRRARRPDPLRATMWTTPSASSNIQLKFEFPFTPQQIQYTNLSPEISEIQRPGRKPLVVFSRYRARQIALRFLIAVPQDGLFSSVDQSIQDLQLLVSKASPVYFTNLDRQITNGLSAGSTQQIFWSIIDFSISSIRRNGQNQITAAEATLTLVENTNPKLKVADLPKISYTSETPQNNPPRAGSRDVDLTRPTWTESEAASVARP